MRMGRSAYQLKLPPVPDSWLWDRQRRNHFYKFPCWANWCYAITNTNITLSYCLPPWCGIQLKLREVTCTLEAVVLISGQGVSTMYYQCQVLFFMHLSDCWPILLMMPLDTNIYYKRMVKLLWLENHCSRYGACRKGELAFLLIDSYLFSPLVWVDRQPYMMSKDTHQLYDLWFPSGSPSVDFLSGI